MPKAYQRRWPPIQKCFSDEEGNIYTVYYDTDGNTTILLYVDGGPTVKVMEQLPTEGLELVCCEDCGGSVGEFDFVDCIEEGSSSSTTITDPCTECTSAELRFLGIAGGAFLNQLGGFTRSPQVSVFNSTSAEVLFQAKYGLMERLCLRQLMPAVLN